MYQDMYEDSLYGQILSAEWEDDTLPGIVLLIDGSEEVIVENDENSEQLEDYIDRWVTLEGIITETEDELRIKVRNYTFEDTIDYEDEDAW